MLTKELIRVRRQKGRILPQFLNVKDSAALDSASQLLLLYRACAGRSRGELEEEAAMISNAAPAPLVARGFDRILLQRTAFRKDAGKELEELRGRCFAAAAKLHREGLPATEEELRAAVIAADPGLQDFIDGDLYRDLPENEVAESFEDISEEHLLHRYNLSLVQGLLLSAQRLQIEILEPEPAQLRRLFKYLRFFRLMALVTAGPRGAEAGHLLIEVDGPASLFDSSQKYGVQLASFFPALVDLHSWRLRAEITHGKKPGALLIDERDGLVGFYRHFGAHVPEEIKVFHQSFKDRSKTWEITSGNHLQFADGEIIFPDLSFSWDGRIRHLELFHRWHTQPLLRRLEQLGREPGLGLLIGVERTLLKDPAVAAALAAHPSYLHSGFEFRDFPGVPTVLNLLNRS
ncbi:MAG: hypothetical protein RL095_2821 [Verrucomicrobiota bacterium]|jgi:predicted nuclease of restriction endonuclease-like RecB superfamily